MHTVFGALMQAADARNRSHPREQRESASTVSMSVPQYERGTKVLTISLFCSTAQIASSSEATLNAFPHGIGHWRFFCDLEQRGNSNMPRSLEINSRKMNLQRYTRLDIIFRNYPRSIGSTVLCDFRYTAKAGTTVQDVIDILLANNRDCYILNADGTGCFAWCAKVLEDFEAAGVIATGAAARAREEAIVTRVRTPWLFPVQEAAPGIFYTPSYGN